MGPTFIYRPRSGDRVFAENPCVAVVIIKWANGCRHVLGGVALRYWTAEAGQHWRDAAKTAAASIVAACGGIAWDEQGSISLVVPRAAALQVDVLMKGIAATAGKSVPADQNIPTLIVEGAPLRFSEAGGFLVRGPLRPDWDISAEVELVHHLPAEGDDDPEASLITRRWKVAGVDHLTGGSCGVVHAPESWGSPEVLWCPARTAPRGGGVMTVEPFPQEPAFNSPAAVAQAAETIRGYTPGHDESRPL